MEPRPLCLRNRPLGKLSLHVNQWTPLGNLSFSCTSDHSRMKMNKHALPLLTQSASRTSLAVVAVTALGLSTPFVGGTPTLVSHAEAVTRTTSNIAAGSPNSLSSLPGAGSSMPSSSAPGADGGLLGSVSPEHSSSSSPSAPGQVSQPRMTRPVLWSENFDNVATPTGFSHEAPSGFDSTSDGYDSGEARWGGWTFSNIRDWTWATGTDKRHWFNRGHNTFAVIDSKQQRLAEGDELNAHLRTPNIDVAGRDRVALEFDSHYRAGDRDGVQNNGGHGDQFARVTASFDGGEEREVARFEKDKLDSHEDLSIDVPSGAHSVRFNFEYLHGNDDWFWAVDNLSVTEPWAKEAGEPHSIVDVVSDVHNDENYNLAVDSYNGMSDKAGAMVFDGDSVDMGDQENYDKLRELLKKNPHHSGQNLFSVGNHEMLGKEGSEAYTERFMDFTGQETLWTEKVVDGTPLITVNTEHYEDTKRGGKEPFVRLSQKQLNWLDSRLKYWNDQGKPAFLFTHLVLPNTVSMTHSAWYQNDFEDLQAFSDVVGKYPNAFVFTGHSHSSLRQHDWWGTYRYDPANNAVGNRVINTGAVLNEFVPDGDNDEKPIDDKKHASGLRVRVFDDRVRVEAWDFVKNEKIQEHDFPLAR